MAQRQSLHQILKNILESESVYFDPPPTMKMVYEPNGAIVYRRDFGLSQFADNNPFRFEVRYQIIYMSRDPDSSIWQQIAMLPKCVYDRHYTADNLHHDVFKIFF